MEEISTFRATRLKFCNFLAGLKLQQMQNLSTISPKLRQLGQNKHMNMGSECHYIKNSVTIKKLYT